MWPELFANFEVTFVDSSVRAPNPLKPVQPQSASDIVRNQLPKSADAGFRSLPVQIQSGLDHPIKDMWISKKLRPYVHAEILVHDWLQRKDHTRPSDFFNGILYIGASKPTCRLCEYYLSGHPSGIEVRKSHLNLYPAWRMPDPQVDLLHGETTPEEAQARKEVSVKLLVHMLTKLRLDAERMLARRGGVVPGRRPHDSDAVSSFAARSRLTGWQLAITASGGSVASDAASVLSSSDAGMQVISEDNGEGANIQSS